MYASLGVQSAEWLVEQKHLGVVSERTSNRYTLLLSTRKLRRILLPMFFQLHKAEQLVHRFANLLALASSDLQTITNIFLDSHLRKQRVRLKDDADSTFTCRKIGYVFSVEDYLARVWLFEARDDAKDRCLAAA
jgi:hypothetical protein